jgi:hyperosmotically inducible protein
MRHDPNRALGLLTAWLIGAGMSTTPTLAADTGDAKQEPSSDQRQVGEFIDDAVITTKIKTLLLKEDLLSALKIDVDTKDGMVRLSGQVEKSEQVARAVDVASKVAGVKSVQVDLLLKKK